jgi:alpha-1,2-mannosyltransferase
VSERTVPAGEWWRSTRGRALVLATLAIIAAVLDVLFAARHGFFDLNVYYGAINYWADGGEIYDFVRRRSTYGFTYPPFAALTMSPMAVLPWPLVIVISVLTTVAATVWLLTTMLAPTVARVRAAWFVVGLALVFAAVFEPLRETLLFGQVNMLLLVLVAADVLLLVGRGSRWAGIGIGLATAIKLTPGVFIIYLLITRRWRAAGMSIVTAAAATLIAGALAPDATREFWTNALWDTDRVGVLSFISNQSLQGAVARLTPAHPSRGLWLALVLLVLAVWFVRSRRAVARGDEAAGLALTGVVGLLVSPVTWVHHLVWLIPALILVVNRAFAEPPRSVRRWSWLAFALVTFVVLSSRVVWQWEQDFSGIGGFAGSNLYVWASLALLFFTPIGRPPTGGSGAPENATHGDQVDPDVGRPVGPGDAVRAQTVAGVEP